MHQLYLFDVWLYLDFNRFCISSFFSINLIFPSYPSFANRPPEGRAVARYSYLPPHFPDLTNRRRHPWPAGLKLGAHRHQNVHGRLLATATGALVGANPRRLWRPGRPPSLDRARDRGAPPPEREWERLSRAAA